MQSMQSIKSTLPSVHVLQVWLIVLFSPQPQLHLTSTLRMDGVRWNNWTNLSISHSFVPSPDICMHLLMQCSPSMQLESVLVKEILDLIVLPLVYCSWLSGAEFSQFLLICDFILLILLLPNFTLSFIELLRYITISKLLWAIKKLSY